MAFASLHMYLGSSFPFTPLQMMLSYFRFSGVLLMVYSDFMVASS